MDEVSKEQEIAQIGMEKPHVVILGAGASLASFPDGDKNGRRLPLMNNFVEVLGLSEFFKKHGVDYKGGNFEELYDFLYKEAKYNQIRSQLEEIIYNYFSSLEISDKPTIYDHLLLSLRSKDVIATFNWDPFLIQAYRRNGSRFSLPRLDFLHGNVMIGSCEEDKVLGINGNACSKCGSIFSPSPLLYPISEKNYHSNVFISSQWSDTQASLKTAFMITVFGYGAPKSDVSAIELLKNAWGDIEERSMEQTGIIDIRPEDDLRETWDPFIHTHHYEIHSHFFESWIAKHPRRTGEAYINQYYNAQFIEDNPIPIHAGFPEIWEWYKTLRDVEIGHGI